MDRKESFYTSCMAKWGGAFNYPVRDFTDQSSHMTIRCLEHDIIFRQKAQNHLRGTNGCSECKKVKSAKPRGETPFLDVRPDLFLEIDSDTYLIENDKAITRGELDKIPKGSHTILPWMCKEAHMWKAKVKDRVGSENVAGTGCPECESRVVGADNNLLKLYPDVAAQLHPRNEIDPKTIAPMSHAKLRWKCDIDPAHDYFMEVSKRTSRESGCPYCVHRRAANEHLIANTHPNFAAQWAPSNTRDISTVTYGSSYIADWICEHGKQFSARVCDYTSGGVNCPCIMSRNRSQKALRWLRGIEKSENIIIQHAENGGEYRIPGTKYHADGYCAETNTVYEFHGSYWHGDPKKYNPGDINPSVGKTYGELYARTIARENEIKALGYNFVIMWESDI